MEPVGPSQGAAPMGQGGAHRRAGCSPDAEVPHRGSQDLFKEPMSRDSRSLQGPSQVKVIDPQKSKVGFALMSEPGAGGWDGEFVFNEWGQSFSWDR